jgi:hypothetical protein
LFDTKYFAAVFERWQDFRDSSDLTTRADGAEVAVGSGFRERFAAFWRLSMPEAWRHDFRVSQNL